jgi:hypothetical protein
MKCVQHAQELSNFRLSPFPSSVHTDQKVDQSHSRQSVTNASQVSQERILSSFFFQQNSAPLHFQRNVTRFLSNSEPGRRTGRCGPRSNSVAPTGPRTQVR